MENCLLCKKNKADKKGSHIVPHFLLKRIENIEGEDGRDYEIGFSIGEFNTETNFGRSIQPEKLNEVFGELSDDEIETNKHPLIVDYFFCSSCETRFSKTESEYSTTLNKYSDTEYDSGIPAELGLLFWASILWRMSINKKSGVRLTKNENEVLREILDTYLADEISTIDIESMRTSKDFEKLNYKLFRCPDFTDKYPTYLLFHPEFSEPYTLIIDEFVLMFSLNGNYNDYKKNSCFGIKDEVFKATTNKSNSNEYISTIEEARFLKISEELINYVKTIRLTKLDLFFNQLHINLGGKGKTMPDKIKREILEELTSEEKKLGRKYNIEDLLKSTMKIMKKYAP